MNITTDTPDLLVLRFTRWKEPLVLGALTLIWLILPALLITVVDVPNTLLIGWLLVTVGFSLPVAILRAEKSMLVLNATTGRADLSHRDVWGLHQHHWPLDEVQSTRISRWRNHGPAAKDPTRMITLYVRDGMDEGRHKLTKRPIPAEPALAASARVSGWMKEWRKRPNLPDITQSPQTR